MKIPLHLILIYFLCRIHPRPTMSDEVFCGELDKNYVSRIIWTAAYEKVEGMIWVVEVEKKHEISIITYVGSLKRIRTEETVGNITVIRTEYKQQRQKQRRKKSR